MIGRAGTGDSVVPLVATAAFNRRSCSRCNAGGSPLTLTATGTPTVVVLLNGRVLSIPALAAHVPAIVEAWLPGEEGGHAVADVLFGAVSPSGRLPVSMPRDVGQVPLYHSRKWASGKVIGFDADYVDLASTPLFPFGHGLSYTRFEYAALAISPAAAATGTPVEISLAVRNAGTRAGAEVVQLYVQDVVASVTRPLQQLAGFARIELAPGETRCVRFTLDASQLAFYDRAMRFVVEPGEFRIRVGASSEDIRLEGSFHYEGAAVPLDPREVRPTAVRA